MTEQKALEVLKSWLRLAYQNADGTDEASAELYEALQTIFSLISRQQEEIEQLKFEAAKLLPKDCPCAIQTEVSSKLEAQIKSEAIKEFASKIKDHKQRMFSSDWSSDYQDDAVRVEVIDSVLKAMMDDNSKYTPKNMCKKDVKQQKNYYWIPEKQDFLDPKTDHSKTKTLFRCPFCGTFVKIREKCPCCGTYMLK